MRSGGDVRSFFRQQKAHAAGGVKPTGGVSKKAALPRHHHKPASQGAFLLPRRQIAPSTTRGGTSRRRRRRRGGRGWLGSSTWTCGTGPGLGLTRAQRWRRAAALGLAPPPAVIAVCSDDQPCLWEGRV
ncbi:hypothetical protein OsJ_26149 [Oryza sativa Japonica Group]|uniref:Uncharacterized protein n=1 Tax=Oryza sativa subsp. japonica TaxID=39947 RepID=B9FZ78_ORYSJ|nr:hypothetical protein OsJ_26149 [Oryza sativa Japonica Group]